MCHESTLYIKPNHYLQSFGNGFHQSCLTYFFTHSFRIKYLTHLRIQKTKSCWGRNPEHTDNQLSFLQNNSHLGPRSQGSQSRHSAAVPAAQSTFHARPHSPAPYNRDLETTDSRAMKLQTMKISKSFLKPWCFETICLTNQDKKLTHDSEETQLHPLLTLIKFLSLLR